MRTALESKTVRPGMANARYYHSNRYETQQTKVKKSFSRGWVWLAVLIVAGYALLGLQHQDKPTIQPVAQASKIVAPKAAPVASVAVTPAVNHCSDNQLPKLVNISIASRHMWVCEGTQQVHDDPIISGMQTIAENATPPGTYKIYAKRQDTVLSGTASTGSWREPVSYWMPFLDNQYGTYGFHDAGWRSGSEFGNTDPNSTKGSHGCIQMTVATASWLYSWADVGTAVTITVT